ncbi:MAG: RNA-binding transcriptional accessory protein [Clostridia bacterium]|nr:RNA-binding transcriptional accessory protein [Clostridia bacterium]
MDILQTLTKEFSLQKWQVENTVKLLDDGNTIPFIARYRKEAHGTLDDQVLRRLSERLAYLRNLEKRRGEVFESIAAQEKMTPQIEEALRKAATLSEIEDVYRPFRPKRRTRASAAREKGLEPLAAKIMAQEKSSDAPLTMAQDFIDPEKGVETAEDALQGALDILAEDISDNADIRRRLRNLFAMVGVVSVEASDPDKDSVYRIYYSYSEPVSRIAGHRVLAIDRGEKEGFLKVGVTLDPVKASNVVTSVTLRGDSPCTDAVRAAGADAYERLIRPSVERETRNMLTHKAAEAAIRVFAANLHELLLQPPVKGKTAIGLDPGYRTGCKVAVVDATGKVLDTNVLYLTHSDRQRDAAKQTLKHLIRTYDAQIIAIGNGTASKETEIFTAEVLREIPHCTTAYMVVSEAGASVYSASKLAAEEFPQYDVSLRSAVSIARRLQDPLSELVKIDPKAIGVGQYQHDMPQKELTAALDGVVEDCVNSVGVDLNTASAPLLSHVAGINAAVAKNIVSFREENGAFTGRAQLKKVPKLGDKAFTQCAGFLRIPESRNLLDNTGVHPESYALTKSLLDRCGLDVQAIRAGKADVPEAITHTFGSMEKAAEALGAGLPTLSDIVRELQRPGRDPRDELPPPLLRTDVMQMSDLKPGMELRGTVRNVIDFGAFVDVGVHQDGLVHISQISEKRIRHPSDVLKVGEVVTVWVQSVDTARGRISLTMRRPGQEGK